jgi:cytoskeletal protein CcmA (bactofilin family)
MPSIIGADLKVVGNLSCDSDIDIQGTVEGDIEAKTVTVDKDARIDGSIRARSVIVSGTVDGKLEATEISLTSTSQVTGELLHDTLSVDPGACLEARLSRISKERRIAAQIPKPKLDTPESESARAQAGAVADATAKSGETPAAAPGATTGATTGAASGASAAGASAPGAAATKSAADDEADEPEAGSSQIPEVFDRRKKQATG